MLAPLGLTLLTILAAIGCGGALATRGDATRSERFARCFVAGLPLYGTCVFLVALIGTRWTIAVTIVAAIAGIATIAGNRGEGAQLAGARIYSTVAWLLLGTAFVEAAAVATMPVFSLDEIAYHLAAVRTWALEGRALELPLLSHAYFPFGVESASLPLYALLDAGAAELASHLASVVMSVCVTLLAYSIVARRQGRATGAAAALAIATTPAMMIIAGWTWADWPTLGAGLLLVDALLDEEIDARRIALPLAAGLLTKYTFAPLALLLVLARVISRRSLERPLLTGSAAGAALGSIFFLRNLVWTGNPFAPLFGELAPDVRNFRYRGSALATLRSYVWDVRVADEALLISLLLVLVIGLVTIRRSTSRHATSAFFAAVASFVLLAATAPSSRILVPPLACAVVAALSAVPLETFFGGAIRTLLLVVAVVQAGVSALYFDSLDTIAVVTKQLDRTTFLARFPSYGESQWANAKLPRGSRTLVVGLNTLYWFETPVRGGGNFDGPRVNAYLEEDGLPQRLRRDGFTHVAIFDRGLFLNDPLRRERATHLSKKAVLNLYLAVTQHATTIAEERQRHLYRLR